jgi:hypothetical protein
MKEIKVKGKDEAQQVYAVLGRKDNADAPQSIEELRQLLGMDESSITGGAPGEEKKYEILEK